MASVITSSIPTETIFDTSTLTSLSTFRTRIRSTQVTTLTSEFIDIDDDGDLITVTSEIEEDVVSTSTSTGTRTRTRLTSLPIETLYSVSVSTSTTDDDDETTTSISLSRQPLIPTTSSSSTSPSDEVVVVTQFTTITPTLSTTSPSSPTLASSSSSSSSGRNPVFPGASSSIPPGNASDNTSSSRTGNGSALSSGAIAGIAIGAIAAAILLGILGFLFCCRKRNNRNGGRHESMYATTRGGGGNHSDEKLATSLFDPAYQHQSYQHQNQQGPSRMRSSAGYGGSSSSAGNGHHNAGLMSAGAAGVGAGVGAAYAAHNNYSNSNGSGSGNNGRRTSGNNGNHQTGKNKPVPDVPPPVSNLQYTRPPPGSTTTTTSGGAYYAQPQAQRGYNNAPYYGAAGIGGGAGAAAAAAATIGRPSTASPNLATQNARNANAGAGGKRTSAPTPSAYAENVSFPIQTPSEKAEALKRSKSIASSVKSIPTEKLGKGSGYASPMPPLDPLGKPLDQKTWRERQSKIKTGFIPDTMLTQEQKLRRDSQIAKLKAIQAGTASSVTPLGKVQEKEEPVETSPLLQQGDQSFERQSSPERISNIYPARHQSLRKDSYSGNNTNKRPESETLLAYASPEPSTSRTNPFPAAASQPARSPSPPRNTIYPSLPPNSPSRSAALTQSSQGPPPTTQPRYELHQPQAQSFNPIRASFITAPQSSSSSSNGGPPPAPSSQAFNSRLPPIPGSRPSSMMTSSTPLPECRRSSNASYSGTPYAAAAAAAGAGGASSQSPNPFFMHANGSGNSFGNSSNGRGAGGPSTSIADDIYGGLTKGLSDRDLLRLSQSQQANAGRK